MVLRVDFDSLYLYTYSLLLVFQRKHYYQSTESKSDATAEVFEKDKLLHSAGSMTNSNHNTITPVYGSITNTGSINS